MDLACNGRMLPDRHVLVANGLVTAVSATPIESPSGALVMDGPGVLAPGFVDTHVHGRCGFDVMRPGDVAPLSVELLAQGVTGFLPTVVAAPPDALLAALAAVRGDPDGARVLGVHAEGPFLSPDQPGMFPPDAFRDYDRALWRDMQTAAAAPIRLMTVAAERLDPAQLDELRADGVTLSLGHTDASYEQGLAAFDSGVKRVTHAYNAMRGFHHRAPGAVGALLDRGDVDAELILDGLHVARAPGPNPRRHPHHRANRPYFRQRAPGRLSVRQLRLGRATPQCGRGLGPLAQRPPGRQRPHPGRRRTPRRSLAGRRPRRRAAHGLRSPARLHRA